MFLCTEGLCLPEVSYRPHVAQLVKLTGLRLLKVCFISGVYTVSHPVGTGVQP
jgi:hypothetical protein